MYEDVLYLLKITFYSLLLSVHADIKPSGVWVQQYGPPRVFVDTCR